MTHADAAHTKNVSLACVVACNSEGVIVKKSAYIKFDILPKFIRSMSHNVACKILLKLHSVQQA